LRIRSSQSRSRSAASNGAEIPPLSGTRTRTSEPQIVRLLRRALTSERRGEGLDRLLSLAQAMRDTSLCPLGQSPILPIESAMRHFRDEFLACAVTA